MLLWKESNLLGILLLDLIEVIDMFIGYLIQPQIH